MVLLLQYTLIFASVLLLVALWVFVHPCPLLTQEGHFHPCSYSPVS